MIKKCGWFFISVILLCTCLFAVPSYVHADSGWDSDYGGSDWGGSDWDSGSSWDSDWDSGSSWDSDWDSGSSSHRSRFDDAAVEFMLFFWVVTVVIIVSLASRNRHGNNVIISQEPITNIGDEDDLVQKFFPNLTEAQLLDILEKKFVDVQNAWMNFDYSALEKLCTKELYESYKSDLEILNSKGQKNVMSNFKRCSIDITDIKEENGLVTVSIYLHMSFYDYVIDVNSDKVVRGKANFVHHNQYRIDYVISKNYEGKCLNCGAEINGEAKCPYCNTPVSDTYKDFVMSKKSRIS